MNITKNHIGNVLCRYKDGKRIMITDVGDKVIKFISESWGQTYNTTERTFNGTVDYSMNAGSTFLDNLNYARVMDYAEISALHKVLSGDPAEKEDGDYMLITISKQRETFIEKINKQAHDRKNFLFNRFQQDYLELKAKDQLMFFGATVEKPADREGYIINGSYYESYIGESVLLGQNNKTKMAPSFNELVDSALQRTTKKESDDKLFGSSIDTPKRE